MTKRYPLVLAPFVLTLTLGTAWGQTSGGGSETVEELERLGPYERNAEKLGPVFARHGYVFLYLFRRGVGLSTDQGANAVDLMNSEFAAHGQQARNALQVQLLENREMEDTQSALKYLRALPYVDARDVAAIGHSFGGSLTVLLAEREPNLRAVVVFSGAGYSFDRSPELRARLIDYSLSSGKVLDARREMMGKAHMRARRVCLFRRKHAQVSPQTLWLSV